MTLDHRSGPTDRKIQVCNDFPTPLPVLWRPRRMRSVRHSAVSRSLVGPENADDLLQRRVQGGLKMGAHVVPGRVDRSLPARKDGGNRGVLRRIQIEVVLEAVHHAVIRARGLMHGRAPALVSHADHRSRYEGDQQQQRSARPSR
jgi:hypothetical protein